MVVDSHEVICSLTGNKDSENRKEWAELIAAAPDLLAALIKEREEVKWLRKTIERAVSTLRSPDPDDLEDGPYYHAEMLSFTDQMICYALDILEGKE